MTIIINGKNIGRSRGSSERVPVPKSCALPTELHGLDGWKDRGTNRWIDGDGWMDGWIDG